MDDDEKKGALLMVLFMVLFMVLNFIFTVAKWVTIVLVLLWVLNYSGCIRIQDASPTKPKVAL